MSYGGVVLIPINEDDNIEEEEEDVYKITLTIPVNPKKLVRELDDRGRPIHARVTCDICEQSPIRGIRYKCTDCDDFDMCQDCEAKNEHPTNHIIMKIPVYRRIIRWSLPLSGLNMTAIEQIK